MSLDKAIANGKEYRKPYKKAKAIDKCCRNHGDCTYCLGNRKYNSVRREQEAQQKMVEVMYEEDNV